MCKRRIEEIVSRGKQNDRSHDNGGGGGHGGNNIEVMEMLIPGNRCGVVIGKGGETIKRLNEEYGVKLVLIQDAETPLNADKPLRITGEPDRVARVKDAVMALINPPPIGDRRGGPPGGGPGGGYRGDRGGGDDRGEYGTRRGGAGDRYAGGRDDGRGGRDDNGRYGGGGRDDGRGGGNPYGGGHGGGNPYGGPGGGAPGKDGTNPNYGMPQCTIRVPGDRAGFVIGKGNYAPRIFIYSYFFLDDAIFYLRH